MSRVRRLANWIDFFVSLLAAVYILTVVWSMSRTIPGFWREVFGFTTTRAPAVWAALTLALLLVLGAVLRAVQHVAARGGGRYLLFDTPNGHVSVRAGCVEEVINRTVRAMGDVADADATLDLPKGAAVPTVCKIRCRLYNRPNLLAVQDQVRAVTRQTYVEMFPSEEPLAVEISVERIVFESKAPQAAPAPAPDLDQGDDGGAEPIRPQYPVDDS